LRTLNAGPGGDVALVASKYKPRYSFHAIVSNPPKSQSNPQEWTFDPGHLAFLQHQFNSSAAVKAFRDGTPADLVLSRPMQFYDQPTSPEREETVSNAQTMSTYFSTLWSQSSILSVFKKKSFLFSIEEELFFIYTSLCGITHLVITACAKRRIKADTQHDRRLELLCVFKNLKHLRLVEVTVDYVKDVSRLSLQLESMACIKGIKNIDSLFQNEKHGQDTEQHAERYFSQVKSLDISRNKLLLFAIPDHVQLLSCTHIDLSKNMLTSVPEVLSTLPLLHYLNMGHNQVTTLKTVTTSFNCLVFLGLEGNKISTLEGIENFKRVHMLTLGGNCIESSNALANLSQLDHLEELEMLGNPICNKVLCCTKS
jgi:Leucine-rich repeat (LRR) protein